MNSPETGNNAVTGRIAAIGSTAASISVSTSQDISLHSSTYDLREERRKRVVLTSGTLLASRLVSALTPIITIPITLSYMGPERYGLWMTVTTVTSFFAFADLGLGNGVLTALAKANGNRDITQARVIITTALSMLTAVAFIGAALFLAFAPHVSWSSVFNATYQGSDGDALAMTTVLAVGFVIGVPVGLIQKIQLGFQEGFQSNIWQCVGSIVTLGAIVAGVKLRVSIEILVGVYSIVPLLVSLANSAVYFGWLRRDLRPDIKLFDATTGLALLKQGALYLVLSLIMAAALGCDNLIVAHIEDLTSVAGFSIAAKLAAVLLLIPNLVVQPLWGAYGEAIARGDAEWVRRSIGRMQIAGAIASLACGGALVVGAQYLLPLWLQSKVQVPTATLAGLALVPLGFAVAGPLFMVLNSQNQVVSQIRLFSIFALVSVPLKILLVEHIGTWIIGWIGAITYVLVVLLPLRADARSCLQNSIGCDKK